MPTNQELYPKILDEMFNAGIISNVEPWQGVYDKALEHSGDEKIAYDLAQVYRKTLHDGLTAHVYEQGAADRKAEGPFVGEFNNARRAVGAGTRSISRGVANLFRSPDNQDLTDDPYERGAFSEGAKIGEFVGGAVPYAAATVGGALAAPVVGTTAAGATVLGGIGTMAFGQSADAARQQGFDRSGQVAAGIVGGGTSMLAPGVGAQAVKSAIPVATQRVLVGSRAGRVGLNAAEGVATGTALGISNLFGTTAAATADDSSFMPDSEAIKESAAGIPSSAIGMGLLGGAAGRFSGGRTVPRLQAEAANAKLQAAEAARVREINDDRLIAENQDVPTSTLGAERELDIANMSNLFKDPATKPSVQPPTPDVNGTVLRGISDDVMAEYLNRGRNQLPPNPGNLRRITDAGANAPDINIVARGPNTDTEFSPPVKIRSAEEVTRALKDKANINEHASKIRREKDLDSLSNELRDAAERQRMNDERITGEQSEGNFDSATDRKLNDLQELRANEDAKMARKGEFDRLRKEQQAADSLNAEAKDIAEANRLKDLQAEKELLFEEQYKALVEQEAAADKAAADKIVSDKAEADRARQAGLEANDSAYLMKGLSDSEIRANVAKRSAKKAEIERMSKSEADAELVAQDVMATEQAKIELSNKLKQKREREASIKANREAESVATTERARQNELAQKRQVQSKENETTIKLIKKELQGITEKLDPRKYNLTAKVRADHEARAAKLRERIAELSGEKKNIGSNVTRRGSAINPADLAIEGAKKLGSFGAKVAREVLPLRGVTSIIRDPHVKDTINRTAGLRSHASSEREFVANEIVGNRKAELDAVERNNPTLFKKVVDEFAANRRAGAEGTSIDSFAAKFPGKEGEVKEILNVFHRGNESKARVIEEKIGDIDISLKEIDGDIAEATQRNDITSLDRLNDLKKTTTEGRTLMSELSAVVDNRKNTAYVPLGRPSDSTMHVVIRDPNGKTHYRKAFKSVEDASAHVAELKKNDALLNEIATEAKIPASDLQVHADTMSQHPKSAKLESMYQIIDRMRASEAEKVALKELAYEADAVKSMTTQELPASGVRGYETDMKKVLHHYINHTASHLSSLRVGKYEEQLRTEANQRINELTEKGGIINTQAAEYIRAQIAMLEKGEGTKFPLIKKISNMLLITSTIRLLGNPASTVLNTASFAMVPTNLAGLGIEPSYQKSISNATKSAWAMLQPEAWKSNRSALDVVIDQLPTSDQMRHDLELRRNFKGFSASDSATDAFISGTDGGSGTKIARAGVAGVMYPTTRINIATRLAAWISAYRAYEANIAKSEWGDNISKLGYQDRTKKAADFADFIIKQVDGDHTKEAAPMMFQRMGDVGQLGWQMKQWISTQLINQAHMLVRVVKKDSPNRMAALGALLAINGTLGILTGVVNTPVGSAIDALIALLPGDKKLADILRKEIAYGASSALPKDKRDVVQNIAKRVNLRTPELGVPVVDSPAVGTVAAGMASGRKLISAASELAQGRPESAKSEAKDAMDIAVPSVARAVESVSGGNNRTFANSTKQGSVELPTKKSLGDRALLAAGLATPSELLNREIQSMSRNRPWANEVNALITKIAKAHVEKRTASAELHVRKLTSIVKELQREIERETDPEEKAKLMAQMQGITPDTFSDKLKQELKRLTGGTSEFVRDLPKYQRQAGKDIIDN